MGAILVLAGVGACSVRPPPSPSPPPPPPPVVAVAPASASASVVAPPPPLPAPTAPPRVPATWPEDGVACGDDVCAVPGEMCLYETEPTCVPLDVDEVTFGSRWTCDSRDDCPRGQHCCLPRFRDGHAEGLIASCTAEPCPHEELCNPASGCASGLTCLEERPYPRGGSFGCYRTDRPVVCGDVRCEGQTPICLPQGDGIYACSAPADVPTFGHECRSPRDCADGSECCVGMGNRCTSPGQCGGGDTPTYGCETLADCPEQIYGAKPTRCVVDPDAVVPGTKLCMP